MPPTCCSRSFATEIEEISRLAAAEGQGDDESDESDKLARLGDQSAGPMVLAIAGLSDTSARMVLARSAQFRPQRLGKPYQLANFEKDGRGRARPSGAMGSQVAS